MRVDASPPTAAEASAQTPERSDNAGHNVMTPEEVARELRVSKQVVYRAAHNRELPSFKVGRRFFFLREEIDALKARGRRTGAG